MIPTEHKEPSLFKLVVVGPEERVVGVHIIGMGSDEALQGFAVAVKMGGEQNTYRLSHFWCQIFSDDGVIVCSDETRIR
jgi:pyruvate/2-oxoglutarate dehydrogenase complex dihydrolipoamide dehydrogenase (E3) component